MHQTVDVLLAWLRTDAGLDDWDDHVERDAVAVTLFISASAVAALVLNLGLHAGDTFMPPECIGGKSILLAMAASALIWLPKLMRATRSAVPAAVFWGLVTLASAALDQRGHGELVDIVWSLVPGYMSIAVVGFFVQTRVQIASLAVYFAAATLLTYSQPRALEMQVAMFGMVVSMGGYIGHLYRRSVRSERSIRDLLHERMRHFSRLLPEPIADALADEADLLALLKPHRRDVIVVAIDVRGSTVLLQRIGAEAYLETVQPMVARLYRHARQLSAFAKFEGDGLLVVFGAFDDQLSQADRMATVVSFLHTAAGAVRAVNRDHARSLTAPLRIGLGVAMGSAVVGSVSDTLDDVLFDVVGEPVAYACRLETLSKSVDSQNRNVVVMGDAVASYLRQTLPLESVQVTHLVRDFEAREPLWLLDLRHITVPQSQATRIVTAA